MAKFCGMIGFAKTQETAPGVWTEVVTEKKYYGELLRNYVRQIASQKVNNDIILNNRISILADSYAFENAQYIVYVVLNGAKWAVYDIDINYPRMELVLGNAYAEEEDDE